MAQEKPQPKPTGCLAWNLANSGILRANRPFQELPHVQLGLMAQFVGVLTCVLVFISSSYVSAQSVGSQDKLHFLLAFGAQTDPNGERNLVSVDDGMVLHSGDRLKFFIETKTSAYFYLAHHNPNGRLTILYPDSFPSKKTTPSNPFYVPESALWIELDHTNGLEKFIFLASKVRLQRLEGLCAGHLALKDPSALQASAASILGEISRLGKQIRSLAGSAERPVFISGVQRDGQAKDSSMLMDITPFAEEIMASGFYSQTFTVDHR